MFVIVTQQKASLQILPLCLFRIYPDHSLDQLNGMCLLDLPLHSHEKPKPFTSLAVAIPQVATVPGPISDPGALNVCTRFPGGVIGPVNASALATTLPGISARQYAKSSAISNSMGTNSIPRISPISSAKTAGNPPPLPPQII